MRRGWLGCVVVAVLGCGPQGNTLGLNGRYLGEGTFIFVGSQTTFTSAGTPSGTVPFTQTQERMADWILEGGVESDAVLTGGTCSIQLDVDGSGLEMDRDTECPSVTTSEQTRDGATTRTRVESRLTYTNVEVKEGRKDNTIKITAEGELTQTEFDGDVRTRELTATFEYDCTPEKVAGE